MRVEFGTTALPVHAPFHRSPAYERACFGAFGSGKTYALADEAIAWCLEQPGIRGGLFRKTVPELRDTTEPVFFERLPHEIRAAGEERRSGGHTERFVFPNGSEVLFRSLDDWNKHRSLNLGFMAIDEANEIDEETYLGMSSRVRQRDPTALARRLGAKEITRRGIWLATNPSGHDWLWKRFVGPEAALNTDYFRSTSFDNPYLPPEYINSLLNYPEPWIRRYVLCEFDDFAGQIYEDWAWDTHVIDPIDHYPPGSIFWMAMDPGTRSPTAGLWAYVDRANRRLVGVAEYQESYTNVGQHAANWRKIEAEHKMHVPWRVSDPGSVTVHDRGSNMALSDQYRRLGYNFSLGPRQHKDRIPMLSLLIATKRFVVTKNCPQTYEQIKNYRWEDVTPTQRAKGVDPPERPLKKDDHLVDCAQYLASRWVRPELLSSPIAEDDFSSKVHRRIREQQRRKLQMRGLSASASGMV